jgi:acyl-coenzyme A synthetase/AMP-(fatty) acid ligase
VPKEIRFVADLPRNQMGKVMRGRLTSDVTH